MNKYYLNILINNYLKNFKYLLFQRINIHHTQHTYLENCCNHLIEIIFIYNNHI